MFIVREGFLQPRLWESFFRLADPERYQCFFYSLDDSYIPKVSNLVQFPNTINPKRGDATYINTVLMMLEHGLGESQNYKFILLSESCIPLIGFDAVYDHVMADDKSYLYHFQVGTGNEEEINGQTKTQYLETEAVTNPVKSKWFTHFFGPRSIRWVNGRFNAIRNKDGIDRELFHKFPAQGICFERELAKFLVETKSDLANYQDVGFLDEYYYLCPLNKRNVPFEHYVRKRNLIAVYWLGSRPQVHSEISIELINRLRRWQYCFLRKISSNCLIDDELTSYILKSQECVTELPQTSDR